MPEGASGYCECSDGAHVAEMNCDHGTFSCIDECKGIVHKQEEILLTDYDMGRRDQRRAVDKLHRYARILSRRRGVGTAERVDGLREGVPSDQLC
eukprot:COSAG02_NODE_7764_length_2857_cov_6.127991_5_plen_95_part_00